MTSVRGRMALSRCSSPSTEGGSTTRVPSAFGTRTASAWPPSLEPPQRSPCTHERGLACTTELAGAIRYRERGDHAIPFVDAAHLRPYLLSHPHPLSPQAP